MANPEAAAAIGTLTSADALEAIIGAIYLDSGLEAGKGSELTTSQQPT
jgi:dsRNA-specific ribonuclease